MDGDPYGVVGPCRCGFGHDCVEGVCDVVEGDDLEALAGEQQGVAALLGAGDRRVSHRGFRAAARG